MDSITKKMGKIGLEEEENLPEVSALALYQTPHRFIKVRMELPPTVKLKGKK